MTNPGLMNVSQLGQSLYSAVANLGDIPVIIRAYHTDPSTLEQTLTGTYRIVSVGGDVGNSHVQLTVESIPAE
jgi:hypothetical protein